MSQIEEFVMLRSYALIGVSAKKKKFGNMILKNMIYRGFKVYPIHKNADFIDGIKCFADLKSLPEKPEGVILCVKPEETEKLVLEIHNAGIKNVWMQQGSESNVAVEYCVVNEIRVISGQCMLMFLNKPGFPHNFHHWVWNIGHKG
jgi:uncharacterized protein